MIKFDALIQEKPNLVIVPEQGYVLTEETSLKMSCSLSGKILCILFGDKTFPYDDYKEMSSRHVHLAPL